MHGRAGRSWAGGVSLTFWFGLVALLCVLFLLLFVLDIDLGLVYQRREGFGEGEI